MWSLRLFPIPNSRNFLNLTYLLSPFPFLAIRRWPIKSFQNRRLNVSSLMNSWYVRLFTSILTFFFYYDFFICCSQFLKFRVFLIWCFGHKIIASWPDSRYLICNYGRLCCLRIRLKVYVCYQNRIYKFWTQR